MGSGDENVCVQDIASGCSVALCSGLVATPAFLTSYIRSYGYTPSSLSHLSDHTFVDCVHGFTLWFIINYRLNPFAILQSRLISQK